MIEGISEKVKVQERRMCEHYWIPSDNSIFVPGENGDPSIVQALVMTREITVLEATAIVEDKTPHGLVITYLDCLKQVFAGTHPQVESISVGPIAILNIKDGEIPECSVVIQLTLNGSVILARDTGETEEQALMNATVKGFREVVKI